MRDKVCWQHPSDKHANQIDQLCCLEDMRNKKTTDIGNLIYHYLMLALLRLRTAAIK